MRRGAPLVLMLGIALLLAGCADPDPGPTSGPGAGDDPTPPEGPGGSSGGGDAPLPGDAGEDADGTVLVPPDVPGTYRCRSFNVDGGGGSCTGQANLVLYPNGAFTFSSTRGTYAYADGHVTFEGAFDQRGPASLEEGQLRWQWTQEGKDYTLTYFRSDDAPGGADQGGEEDGPQDEAAPDHPPELVGSYACTIMRTGDGGGAPCDTTDALVLEEDGRWHYGSNPGTWRVERDRVVFESPYAGGSGWSSAGPPDWGDGTALIGEGTLTFEETVWTLEA